MTQKITLILTLHMMGLMACESKDDLACTEIGCNSSVALTFVGPDGEEVAGLSGTVGSDMLMTDGIEFDCVAEEFGDFYMCEGNTVTFFIEEGGFLEGAESLFVDVNSDPYMVNTEIVLEWVESTPNGEDCPPVCYNSEAEISMDRANPE